MIIPDLNLLLYAYNSDSSFYAKVRAWWEQCLNGDELVGLPQVVVFGFMRVATNPRAYEKPMTPAQAAGHVRSWLSMPNVEAIEPESGHIHDVLNMLEAIGTAGNLVSDAQLAALAIERDAVLHTADVDFARFQGLQWFNPISGVGSAQTRRK